MYLGYIVKNSYHSKDNPKIFIYVCQIVDRYFKYEFVINYLSDKEERDVDYVNQLLYHIYDIYKFSNQPLCKNFKLAMEITFKNGEMLVKKTKFYKEYKTLVDESLRK